MVKNIVVGSILFVMFIYTFFQTIEAKDDLPSLSESHSLSSKEEISNQDMKEDLDINIEGIKRGNIAPDFELEALDGKKVKLSDYKGKKVMINFWATWCPSCRAEMSDKQKVFEDHDVVILGINLLQTEKSLATVEKFIADFGLSYPILLDKKSEVADLYGVQPIPTSFFIDTEGRISHISIGPLNEAMLIQRFNEMK